MCKFFISILILMILAPLANALEGVYVQALLNNMVMLKIHGTQRTLKTGQLSPEGLRLISATPQVAIVEFNGQRHSLSLSKHISTNYSARSAKEVSIRKNKHLQYKTEGKINGRSITMLVDTGANIVALSSAHARQLGLDYRSGQVGVATTASGRTRSYKIQLLRLSVGDIEVHRVDASVIEGDYPVDVLLGMSFLQHVNLSESNGLMTLKTR